MQNQSVSSETEPLVANEPQPSNIRNYEKENENAQQFFFSTSFLCFFLYLLLLAGKLNMWCMKDIDYIFVQIPFDIGIFMMMISCISFIADPQRKMFHFGVIFMINQIIMHAFLIIIYSVLLHIRLDIQSQTGFGWKFVFVPLYMIYGINLLLIIYFLPGFLSQKLKLYRQIFLIIMYYGGSLMIDLGLPRKLDGNIEKSDIIFYINAYLIMTITHLFTLFFQKIYLPNEYVNKTKIEHMTVHCLVFFLIFYDLKYFLEENFLSDNNFQLLPLMILMVYLAWHFFPSHPKNLDELTE